MECKSKDEWRTKGNASFELCAWLFLAVDLSKVRVFGECEHDLEFHQEQQESNKFCIQNDRSAETLEWSFQNQTLGRQRWLVLSI